MTKAGLSEVDYAAAPHSCPFVGPYIRKRLHLCLAGDRQSSSPGHLFCCFLVKLC